MAIQSLVVLYHVNKEKKMRSLIAYMFFASIFVVSTARGAEDTRITELLRPAVRVLSEEGGGSGTIIYSEDREKLGEYQTFVLTNWHVVAGLIKVEKRWSNLRRKWIHTEVNKLADVEMFDYSRGGAVVTKTAVKAEIIAWNKHEDIAVLKLRHPFRVPYVAQILPDAYSLRLFQEAYAVGCPLLVEPLFSYGQITDLEFLIETKEYTVSSAHIIWGNSGGALYVQFKDKWYLAGIPTRVTVAGFFQAVPHMGYHITPKRIRTFLRDEELDFLIDKDPTKTPTRAMLRREWIRQGLDPDEMEEKETEEQKKVLHL